MSNKLSFWSILPIFRATFLSRIPVGDHYLTLREIGDHFSDFGIDPPDESEPLKRWFNFFYEQLRRKYRCEYVYKNALTRDLYLAELHSRKNSLLINEFRSGQSRADVVIINGTSTAYEIKSKYDSLARLDQQIEDYKKIFDRVVVVSHAEKLQAIKECTPPWVGVIELPEKGKIKTVRKAISNKVNTDPAAIFDCMRQGEYSAIIKDKFGFVPDVPNSRFYRASKKMFCQLEPSVAHDCMVQQFLKRRERGSFSNAMLRAVPYSLKHACLSLPETKGLASQIMEGLSKPLKL